MRPRPASAAAFAVLGTVTVVLPVFLAGALAVFIRDDLGFDESRLGISVALFFAVAAGASVLAGRVSERLGAWRGLRISLLATAALLGLIAVTARSWVTFTILLAACGAGNALGQPSANLAIARYLPASRQGLGFGIKQSAPRVSTLLAGAAVPAIGLTVGWRWAFAGAAAVGLGVALLLPSGERGGDGRGADPGGDGFGGAGAGPGGEAIARTPRRHGVLRPEMLSLSAAALCASTAATSMGIFLVETAVFRGIEPGPAGMLLAVGSAAGIGTRLLAGWAIDKVALSPFAVISGMTGVGAVSYVILGTASNYWLLMVGTLLAFCCGWGWNGLMIYLVVRLNPDSPAEASGVTQAGIFAGGVVGPAGFGALASAVSYTAAWTTIAVLAAAASVMILLVRSMVTARSGTR